MVAMSDTLTICSLGLPICPQMVGVRASLERISRLYDYEGL